MLNEIWEVSIGIAYARARLTDQPVLAPLADPLSRAMRGARSSGHCQGNTGCYAIERIEPEESAAQVFTVSPALGFAEAERCQATTLILQAEWPASAGHSFVPEDSWARSFSGLTLRP